MPLPLLLVLGVVVVEAVAVVVVEVVPALVVSLTAGPSYSGKRPNINYCYIMGLK